MRERGHGAILNVSSVASFIANGTYSAEKAFVTVFTEGLASELAGTGVTATALCPGFTRTEFHARAGIRTSALPESLWLDADDVVQQALTEGRKFAQCMRAHGEPKFPDPTGNGLSLHGSGIDPKSPQFQAAKQTCRSLLPALGTGTGSGS